jgi:hypothetical protein
MKQYYLVAPNGEIKQTMTCDPELVHLLEVNGCVAHEGFADPETQYVKNGEIVSKGEQPDDNHRFDFDLEEWVDYRTDEDLSYGVRMQRNAILLNTDWTQLPNAQVDSESWEVFRQALRDITEQPGFPRNVIWPKPPN